jgi:hypothetical protein
VIKDPLRSKIQKRADSKSKETKVDDVLHA